MGHAHEGLGQLLPGKIAQPVFVNGIVGGPERADGDGLDPLRLELAQFLARLPGGKLHMIWKTRDPVPTDAGFSIVPTTTFADCPQLDVICVPGGYGINDLLRDEETLEFLRAQAKGARYVTSVCTGSLVLGAAGLLRGKRATTHWASQHFLASLGAIAVNERVVQDGNLVGVDKINKWATLLGLGVKSGIDLPNEVAGLVPSSEWKQQRFHEKWYAGETISVSIGQGQVSVTPVSMAVYAATLANGGLRVTPHVLTDQTSAHDALTGYVPTDEKVNNRYPLLLTTGRILSQYNVGAQTRRTGNVQWHGEDVLEIHPHDADERGIRDGDEVTLASRVGATTLRAVFSDRMPPGVVYTTFHHPVSGANVVTTQFSDWATNCPEYKVTAVQVMPGRSAATVEIDHPEHRLGALVRMANQIARQQAADASVDAVAITAKHLDSFWDHEMRVDLARAVEAGTIESSSGRASVTPTPRIKVRREICFFVM